jgi:hypothetical protein
MFGKRNAVALRLPPGPDPAPASPAIQIVARTAPAPTRPPDRPAFAAGRNFARSEGYYDTKKETFSTLIDSIDKTIPQKYGMLPPAVNY